MLTPISGDPNNGAILKSTDYGSTWAVAANLPFKVGGNMPGRGMGERLVFVLQLSIRQSNHQTVLILT